MPNSTPRPVQFPVFRKEQLQTDEGMAAFNLSMSQIVNAINQNNGQAGTVVLPSGVDVQGSSVTGLGAPSDPTDAVSLGHSNSNYGAPAVGPQLDIGGSNTLKGLAYTYKQSQLIPSLQNQIANVISGTIGANGNITFSNGLIIKWGTTPTGNPYAVSFLNAFPTACYLVLATPDLNANTSNYVWVGDVSVSGFNIYNNGTVPDAYWIAIGN